MEAMNKAETYHMFIGLDALLQRGSVLIPNNHRCPFHCADTQPITGFMPTNPYEQTLPTLRPLHQGVLQIEAAFDINAGGIMNASVRYKSTGNVKKIAAKNEKGELAQSDRVAPLAVGVRNSLSQESSLRC